MTYWVVSGRIGIIIKAPGFCRDTGKLFIVIYITMSLVLMWQVYSMTGKEFRECIKASVGCDPPSTVHRTYTDVTQDKSSTAIAIAEWLHAGLLCSPPPRRNMSLPLHVCYMAVWNETISNSNR